MLVTVEVTKEDIKSGMPRNPCRCPVALALMRALKIPYVSVGLDMFLSYKRASDTAAFFVRDGNPRPLPPEARVFINAVDAEVPTAHPISFQVEELGEPADP